MEAIKKRQIVYKVKEKEQSLKAKKELLSIEKELNFRKNIILSQMRG